MSEPATNRHQPVGNGWFRRVERALGPTVLVLAPLVMAVLAFVHPTQHNEHDSVAALTPVAGEWLGLHAVLLPAAALVAVGLYWLVASYRGPVALVARVGIAVYAFGATVIDAVNGLAVGLLLTAPDVDPTTIEPALNGMFGGPPIALTGLLTILGYTVGVVATAVVLSRDGAPLPATLALVGSTLGVVSHVGLSGVVGWLLLFVAAVWLTVGWRGDPAVTSRRHPGVGD